MNGDLNSEPTTKAEWRKHTRTLYAQRLSPELRETASQTIISALREEIERRAPQSIGMYAPLGDEPEISPLLEELRERYQLFLPRVESETEIAFYPYLGVEELERTSKYQILEPTQGKEEAVAPESLELIVVPALAFDKGGYRLGRGKGYYDRYLAHTQAYRIGVSLDLAPIGRLPRGAWDLPMDLVITPERSYLGTRFHPSASDTEDQGGSQASSYLQIKDKYSPQFLNLAED